MNVLSLFDGMSCGQQALERAGIKVDKYFAAEIKPHAIKVTQHNYPNTIQLGDVRNIKATDLPKIDLLIGGSPCQDFSQANKERKGLQGEKSSLFYEYLRLLEECNPKYFLLENVAMDNLSYQIISDHLKTYPIDINSELVSAQLRQRSYWTNIGPESFDLFGFRKCDIPLPKDKKIYLQDILESGYTDRLKSTCILEGWSRPHNVNSIDKIKKRYDKGFTTIVFNSEDYDYKKGVRFLNSIEMERLQTVKEGYTSILSRNDAACLLGDGWTVDVIAHIFKYI
jgi:DNA (cytosine-5)-methyltransferase 3A